jgi:anti-sigma B factor antagonist
MPSLSNTSVPRPTPFAISQRHVDERTCVVGVEGELDLASAPTLKWTLVDLFGEGRSRLVLDLSSAGFMDSVALSVLIGIERNLEHDQRMAIASPQPAVMRIFEVTGLVGAFHIFSTVEEALAHVGYTVPPAV